MFAIFEYKSHLMTMQNNIDMKSVFNLHPIKGMRL